MTTSTHNRNYLARIATEMRMSTTPSLALTAKSAADQSAELLAQARICRDMADAHTRAGEIEAARRFIARGRAIVEAHRALGEG
jgi:hypothetical protein